MRRSKQLHPWLEAFAMMVRAIGFWWNLASLAGSAAGSTFLAAWLGLPPVAAVVVIVLGTLALWAAFVAFITDRLEERRPALPQLSFAGWHTEAQRIGMAPPSAGVSGARAASATSAESFTSISETAFFVYLSVLNTPTKGSPSATYTKVELEFFDREDNRLLPKLTARPRNAKNPADQTDFTTPQQFDEIAIPANREEPFDLIFKFQSEACCYVYTNDVARQKTLRPPQTKIKASRFRVVATATCSENSEPISATYEVRLNGIGGQPTLTQE